MPPQIPDGGDSDDSSAGGDVPVIQFKAEEDVKDSQQTVTAIRTNGKAVKEQPDSDASNQGDGDDAAETKGEGLEEDVYEVEAIRSHIFKKGKLYLMVKWKGYKEAENTLEPESELLKPDDPVVLIEYFKSIGGRPDMTKSGKRKYGSQPGPSTDSQTSKKSRDVRGLRDYIAPKNGESDEQVGAWTPSTNSWETEVDNVETIERDSSTGKLSVIVVFNERPTSKQKVNIELARKKFPQKMLAFYERNLILPEEPGWRQSEDMDEVGSERIIEESTQSRVKPEIEAKTKLEIMSKSMTDFKTEVQSEIQTESLG